MALSILDGNQSATTLSTILSSGQHITAHTVVSLGTQAITDMRSAVSGSVVSISNLPATQTIAGTVTIGNLPDATIPKDWQTIGDKIGIGLNAAGLSVDVASIPAISGTVTANVTVIDNINNVPISLKATDDGFLISVIEQIPAISGTVTANSSNGALTTRFGSVTTANTAFSTTAVTNADRKYLFIQNISSGVVTAGIGFTPTTTQGIQLVAGATITFDNNYIPTGAVRILSSVTSSNFTILEA